MPYDVVKKFEATVAEFAGAKYGVAVESCTNALFLSCFYLFHVRFPHRKRDVHLPRQTYPGVPCSVIHAGGVVRWTDEEWIGDYQLRPFSIYDAAKRFRPGMYVDGSLYCLSFHAKKHLPIGRGGMILTDDVEAVEWFKRARFDGRNECELSKDNFTMLGWNMYMQPEQAARGLQLFQSLKNFEDLPEVPSYPDLSKFAVYGG
jgi:dTDP-4-amino-4,6-dideoxygalactose transaminase